MIVGRSDQNLEHRPVGQPHIEPNSSSEVRQFAGFQSLVEHRHELADQTDER